MAHRYLIDFRVILVLLPMTLAGTVLGVLLNTITPTWLIVVIVFLVLTLISFKTLRTAYKMHHLEKLAANAHAGNHDHEMFLHKHESFEDV